MAIACFVFAVWTGLAVFSYRCLYADGCHVFIKVLQAQWFVFDMWSRHFAVAIFEFPLVVAIKMGITNMHLLRFAFGLGSFLPWPIVLMLCHWISPRHFWVVVTACAAGYLNAAFLAIGEHILAHAFYWPSLFVIVFARPLKPLAAAILLGSAACLLFSYESQLFLCLPLAALSLWRIAEEARDQSADSKKERYCRRAVLVVATGLFMTAAAIGLHAILKPEIPANFQGFKATLVGIIHRPGWTWGWTILWGCVALAVWLSERIWNIIRQGNAIMFLFCALIAWGTWPLLCPGDLEPARQYHNRVLDLVVPIMLLPVVLILRYRPLWIESGTTRLRQMAAVLLIAQSSWQICATWQWQADVGRLQGVLSSGNGVIPLHSTILASTCIEGRHHEFDWTWPCLSIALYPGQNIHSLVCSEWYIDPRYRQELWQPFDPLNIESLPDLKHYKLDFSGYGSALRGETRVK